MDLPSDLKIKGLLTQGGVFKAQLHENRDSYSRYYFVLNLNPQTDYVLILATSTTQFEQHRNCEKGDDIHIPLGPQDYSEFKKECCN